MGLYTQTTTFANGNSADGGEVNTEIVNLGASVNSIVDAQIDSSAAIQISKTELSTYTNWTTWSPQLRNTADGADLGGNIRIAKYYQLGDQVHVKLHFDNGGNPGGAAIVVDLPVAPKTDATYAQFLGTGYCKDNNGVGFDIGFAQIPATKSKAYIYANASAPTWNAGGGHFGHFNFIYEVA